MARKVHLRRSEWFFIIFGIALILGSAFCLYANYSFIQFEAKEVNDPFQANYRATPIAGTPSTINSAQNAPAPDAAMAPPATGNTAVPAATPAVPTVARTPIPQPSFAPNMNAASTPEPTPISTPTPVPNEMADRQKVFLLFPASHAFLTNTSSNKKGYPLKLRFEVEPKETPCKFELRHADQIVLAKEFKGSPTGMYEISILVRQPGLYIWQVFTPGTQSEAREFVIKEVP